MPGSGGLLAYCRPGFEGECAQELTEHAAAHGVGGFARTGRGSGFVELVIADGVPTDAIAWRELIFARQLLRVLGRVESLPRSDRLAALMPIIERTPQLWRDARSEERRVGKECLSVCRSRWSPYH